MSIVMLYYVAYSRNHERYNLSFLTNHISVKRIVTLLIVSIPVVIDKVSIAFAYSWLGSCMSYLGPTAGAAFSNIKLMERFAFLPAIAFAQIITFLVSNDVGCGRWDDIHANIKRVLIMAMSMVGTILIIGSIWPYMFINLFDKNHEFGYLVATIFPWLSVLILIDLLQLILSAALRGAGDVQTVMLTRICVIAAFFIPATYVITWFSFDQLVVQMTVTYCAFLLGNAFMSIVYIVRLKQNHWKKRKEKVCND